MPGRTAVFPERTYPMKTRIIVAAIFVPILFVVLFFLPPVWLTILTALICAFITFEFLRALKSAQNLRTYVYAAVSAVLIPFGFYFGAGEMVFRAVIFLLAAIMFVEAMVAYEKEKNLGLAEILPVIFCGAVIPLFLSSLVSLKMMENGKLYVLLPIIAAFLSDSGAYFVGMFMGKHKAFPKLSPKKTVEGCVGGLLSTVIAMLLYGLILMLSTDLEISFLILIVYGIVGSLATQIGDLAYSLIKRQVGVKDYGNLIPGHGGMLDRFDSMSFAAPTMLLLVTVLPAF